jgi:hypothetical protein
MVHVCAVSSIKAQMRLHCILAQLNYNRKESKQNAFKRLQRERKREREILTSKSSEFLVVHWQSSSSIIFTTSPLGKYRAKSGSASKILLAQTHACTCKYDSKFNFTYVLLLKVRFVERIFF